MSTPEVWRPIPGYAGYAVSDLGRVHSTLGRGRILKANPNTHGYPRVSLRVGPPSRRSSETVAVHLLVLAAFSGPRPSGMETRHLNGDRSDCRLTNLRYGTHSENQYDQVQHGTHAEANRTHCSRGHALGGANVYCEKFRGPRACGTCRRAYMRLYEKTTAEERGARKAAGLPVIDLDAYFSGAAA